MISIRYRRTALCLTLALGFLPFLWAPAGGEIQSGPKKQFKGKVVPLKDLLKKINSTIDPEASKYWMALVTEEGEIYPLIMEDRSRMFFTDAEVRNRPMLITGRLFADTHLLQVLDVKSYKKDQLHDIYYWCDICGIRRNFGGICECCGGPMELRELPVRK